MITDIIIYMNWYKYILYSIQFAKGTEVLKQLNKFPIILIIYPNQCTGIQMGTGQRVRSTSAVSSAINLGAPVLSLVGTATSIIFVMTKVLSWQIHVCHDKTFVSTSILLSRQCFETKLLLQQTRICLGKYSSWKSFVPTNIILSQQAYFCRDKRHVLSQQTHVCHNKHMFVATKLLSRQKLYLWQHPPMTLYCTAKSVKPSSCSYPRFHSFHSGALNLISTACTSEIAQTMNHVCMQTQSAMLLFPYQTEREKKLKKERNVSEICMRAN